MQDPNTDYGCFGTFLSAVNTRNSVDDCRGPSNRNGGQVAGGLDIY